jgi:NADPH-dependent curcumin reductase CurA
MRGRLNAAPTYAEGVPLGAVMIGETVGEVIASEHPGFRPGDIAVGAFGWATHILSDGDRLVAIPRNTPAPLSAYLGVLGMPGTTAYSGMTDIGQPRAGETVVISAASGPVGATAGQIARRAGARAIGIAGGPEKCRWVTEMAGFDACLDHRGDLEAQLDAACPNGIDVYFENVGGPVQAAILPRLNTFARVPVCGLVAQYDDPTPPPTLNLNLLLYKRARFEGFIVGDKPERFAEWRALAAPWVASGELRFREEFVDGLENAPKALAGQIAGRNFGKLLVRVAAS